MADIVNFDAIIVQTPEDFKRMSKQHERMCKLLPANKIFFVGRPEIEELLEEEKKDSRPDSYIRKSEFINENDILDFDTIHDTVSQIVSRDMNGQITQRKVTGWYYQQFIKYQYSHYSQNKYYLVWDGDTVPCRDFSMFTKDKIPYLDTKHEYHKQYFNTINKLIPSLSKWTEKSFISEHMLMNCDLIKELTDKIESNSSIPGKLFWEKILHSMNAYELMDTGFSEFETYGTYVMTNHPDSYMLRSWNSMRYGGMFFDQSKISDRDYNWLSRDFFAISFEKDHAVRPDTDNIFNNPEYQKKLSARTIMEMVQEEYHDDEYIEVWDSEENI